MPFFPSHLCHLRLFRFRSLATLPRCSTHMADSLLYSLLWFCRNRARLTTVFFRKDILSHLHFCVYHFLNLHFPNCCSSAEPKRDYVTTPNQFRRQFFLFYFKKEIQFLVSFFGYFCLEHSSVILSKRLLRSFFSLPSVLKGTRAVMTDSVA